MTLIEIEAEEASKEEYNKHLKDIKNAI